MEQTEQEEQIEQGYDHCRKCKQWSLVKERVRIKNLLAKAITKIEDEFEGGNFKPTLGDYLKLVALEKDVDQDDVKEIKVTWVGPKPKSEKSE
jgi:hypothetical protein